MWAFEDVHSTGAPGCWCGLSEMSGVPGMQGSFYCFSFVTEDVLLAWVSAYILKITKVMRKEPGGNHRAHFPEWLALPVLCAQIFRRRPNPASSQPASFWGAGRSSFSGFSGFVAEVASSAAGGRAQRAASFSS